MTDERKKLKAAAHYVIRLFSFEPKKLGKTKLHKVLWYTDGYSFVVRGAPVIGEKYVRAQFGPMCAELDSVLHELESEGRIYSRKVPFHDYEKYEFFSKKEPDIRLFVDKDVALLTDMAKLICGGHAASSISEKTHDRLWNMAKNGEELSYKLFLVSQFMPIRPSDIEWAKKEIERIENHT
jgi:hypothetical protein